MEGTALLKHYLQYHKGIYKNIRRLLRQAPGAGGCFPKLLLVSSGECGVAEKTTGKTGFCHRHSLTNQLSSIKQAFQMQISAYGIAGFFFKGMHQVIFADVKLL